MNTPLPSLLQEIEQQRWQEIATVFQQHSIDYLPEHEAVVKKAITLSDFVYNSLLASPKAILTDIKQRCYQHEFSLEDYEILLANELKTVTDEVSLHRVLRLFRQQHMAAIAIGDLVFNRPLAQSLAKLSHLADAIISQALYWLTSFCEAKWGVPHSHDGKPQTLLIFAMGKLGGRELNFSSDIDLIFSYPQSGETRGARKPLDNQQFFIRLAQKLITALNVQTQDGFVYRVDMRLRPFGESGPLVVNFNAMEDYYQEQGRDWERYAMLKARLIGNSEFHQELQQLVRPFVYRRYIDFSVLDSLRRMKLMVAEEVRRKNLVNNIKLGAGGIREIEFIVQVFQLLRGGQIPALQQRHLLSVLPLLVEHSVISLQTKQTLENAYVFLRRVENILQAFDDKQTQTLPDDDINQQRLITILSFESWPAFINQLNQHVSAVHHEFEQLIGVEHPQQKLEHDDFLTCWLEVESWSEVEIHHWQAKHQSKWSVEHLLEIKAFKNEFSKGRIGQRGRAIIDKLLPLTFWHIDQLSENSNPIEQLLNVYQKIMSRTAYLELLYENEGALKQLIQLCAKSRWIGEHIAKFPIVLDELIDPTILHQPPQLSNYKQSLMQQLIRIPEDDLEAQMNGLRQFKQAQHLRIAAADVIGVISVTEVSDHLTAIAEAIIEAVVNISWYQVSSKFGVPSDLQQQRNEPTQNKGFAVIGYGKLGGHELSYSSDLDLVFIHNSDAQSMTTGERQIASGQFYNKLVQRMMHIFNTRMASGILYELDMRLRPSGHSGVAVVNIESFAQYQKEEAWTWEHQALVRARMIVANELLKQRFLSIRESVLCQSRDQNKLVQDVVSMRNKMRDHLDKSTQSKKDIKHGTGGLVDIEFISQFFVLKYSYQYPQLARISDNLSILNQLFTLDIITESQYSTLTDSYCYLRDIGHKFSLNEKYGCNEMEILEKMAPVELIWQSIFQRN